jgi:UDP-N-acetylglucosamine 3-dehydrogenase
MDKIRFGMIGAGAISNLHLPALAAREDCEIVAIADANLDQARARAEQFHAPHALGDYNELVARDDLDAVVVGIPTQFHADASIKALNNGKHVLCEKPMARTLEECDAMLRAAAAAGRVLQIGMVRRFDDDWGMMRKLAQEGKAGRPCMWRRIIAAAAPQPPNNGAWYSDARFSDGPLPESGAHDLDFLRYTFGDVRAVTAHMDHLSHYGDVLDNTIVILYFESGDQALVQWCWILPRGATAGFRGMDVIGPEGCIHEGVCADGQWTMKVSRGETEEIIAYENRRNEETWGQGQIGDFVRCLKTGGTPRASGEDGRKCQELYIAAVRSMEEGRRIELPL